MSLKLGCIADDYTGASDLANTLTRAGLRTVQTIGVPADDLALPEVDAVVVSLKSRSIEAGIAVEKSRAAEKWLRAVGAKAGAKEGAMLIALKSGNFGGPEFFSDALELMR